GLSDPPEERPLPAPPLPQRSSSAGSAPGDSRLAARLGPAGRPPPPGRPLPHSSARPRDGGVRRRHRASSLPSGGIAGAHLTATASEAAASHNVLPSVVATCPAHTQAPQPSLVVQSLNVHGILPAQFSPGTETLHNLCLGLPSSSIPHLLQLLGELLLVSLHRIPVARISSRSQHSGHLENHNLPIC
ncbi:hypothetical protein Nmel_014897, partial [Mimus melanotis]